MQEDGTADRVIVERIPLSNVQFTDSGMFVRSGIPVETAYGEHRDNGKGWFVQVDRFAWIDRRSPGVAPNAVEKVDTSLAADTPTVGAASADVQAMDVDEAPVVTKSEIDAMPNGDPSPAASSKENGERKVDGTMPSAPAELAPVASAEALASENGPAAKITIPVPDSMTPAVIEIPATSPTLPASTVENLNDTTDPTSEANKETSTNGDGEVKDEPMERPASVAQQNLVETGIEEVKAEGSSS